MNRTILLTRPILGWYIRSEYTGLIILLSKFIKRTAGLLLPRLCAEGNYGYLSLLVKEEGIDAFGSNIRINFY